MKKNIPKNVLLNAKKIGLNANDLSLIQEKFQEEISSLSPMEVIKNFEKKYAFVLLETLKKIHSINSEFQINGFDLFASESSSDLSLTIGEDCYSQISKFIEVFDPVSLDLRFKNISTFNLDTFYLPSNLKTLSLNAVATKYDIQFDADNLTLDTLSFDGRFRNELLSSFYITNNIYYKRLEINYSLNFNLDQSPDFIEYILLNQCIGVIHISVKPLNLKTIEIKNSKITSIYFKGERYVFSKDGRLKFDRDHNLDTCEVENVIISVDAFDQAIVSSLYVDPDNKFERTVFVDNSYNDFADIVDEDVRNVNVNMEVLENALLDDTYVDCLIDMYSNFNALSLYCIDQVEQGVVIPNFFRHLMLVESNEEVLTLIDHDLQTLKLYNHGQSALSLINFGIQKLFISNFQDSVFEFVRSLDELYLVSESSDNLQYINQLPNDLKLLDVRNNFELLEIKFFPDSIEKFVLIGGKIAEFPVFGPNVQEIHIENVKYLYKLPSLKNLKKLKKIVIKNCIDLEKFPLFNSEILEELHVEGCSNLNESSKKRIHKFNKN